MNKLLKFTSTPQVLGEDNPNLFYGISAIGQTEDGRKFVCMIPKDKDYDDNVSDVDIENEVRPIVENMKEEEIGFISPFVILEG